MTQTVVVMMLLQPIYLSVEWVLLLNDCMTQTVVVMMLLLVSCNFRDLTAARHEPACQTFSWNCSLHSSLQRKT